MGQKRKLKRIRAAIASATPRSSGPDSRGRLVVSPRVAILEKNVVEFSGSQDRAGDGDVAQIESSLKEGSKVVLNLRSQIASGMKVDAHELSLPPSQKH
jgi:hypothetical protein